MIERFQGRDDHLMYRSVRYGPVERQHSDLKYASHPAFTCHCEYMLAFKTRKRHARYLASAGTPVNCYYYSFCYYYFHYYHYYCYYCYCYYSTHLSP